MPSASAVRVRLPPQVARATEHAGNAARLDHRDESDLPPPPAPTPDAERDRTIRDLRHAFDRIRAIDVDSLPPEGTFYLDAARDLYRAARPTGAFTIPSDFPSFIMCVNPSSLNRSGNTTY